MKFQVYETHNLSLWGELVEKHTSRYVPNMDIIIRRKKPHILQNILKKNSSLKNIVKFYKINECIALCKSQTTIHHVPTESGR